MVSQGLPAADAVSSENTSSSEWFPLLFAPIIHQVARPHSEVEVMKTSEPLERGLPRKSLCRPLGVCKGSQAKAADSRRTGGQGDHASCSRVVSRHEESRRTAGARCTRRNQEPHAFSLRGVAKRQPIAIDSSRPRPIHHWLRADCVITPSRFYKAHGKKGDQGPTLCSLHQRLPTS